MKSLTVTRDKHSTRATITLSVDGKDIRSERRDPLAATTRRDLRKQFRDKAAVDAFLARFAEPSYTTDTYHEQDATVPIRYQIHVRDREAPSNTARTFDDKDLDAIALLRDVLTAEHKGLIDPIAYWGEDVPLAVLDIDYKGEAAKHIPSDSDIDTYMLSITPTPAFWHRSKNGGIHAYFADGNAYKAEEFAAVAGIAYTRLCRWSTIEIKRDTRIPNAILRICTQTVGMDALREWMGRNVPADAVDAWLATTGYVRGQRYAHSRCPIAPGEVSSSPDPVAVLDAGIHCFSCEGHDRAKGTRQPGFAPWSALVPSDGNDSILFNMARNFVNWSHARHVLLRIMRQQESVLRLAYRSCMRMLAKDANDARIDAAFDKTIDLVRLPGRWVFDGGRTTLARDSRNIISKLPTVQYWKENAKGELKLAADPARVEMFLHGGNSLSQFGYYDLVPVNGIPIWGHYLPYANNGVPFVYHDPRIDSDKRPRYRPAGARMDVKAAEELFEIAFPGINWPYVRALIAARGVAESGESVFINTNGVSGSGKSLTIHIVAAMLGDYAGEPLWQKDIVRYRQSIMSALDKGTFCAINELIKMAEDAGVSARAAFDPILTITPDSMSHQMYTGARTLGKAAVMVMTDIRTPDDIAADVQIARRMLFHRLPNRTPDWRDTCKALRMELHTLRNCPELDLAGAADTIISDMIDRHFVGPASCEDIAKTYGVYRLDKSPAFESPTEPLAAFFQAVADATYDGSTADRARYAESEGWKFVRRELPGALSEAWEAICDSGVDGWHTSRRASSEDWSAVLGLKNLLPIELAIRKMKSGVLAVRFHIGTAAVGREILPGG